MSACSGHPFFLLLEYGRLEIPLPVILLDFITAFSKDSERLNTTFTKTSYKKNKKKWGKRELYVKEKK